MSQSNKDDIYQKKKEEALTAISFLEAISENVDNDTAFKIASDAFEKYMTNLYKNILASTEEGTQERFDKFRSFYEDYAKKTPYLKIIKSTPEILEVKYERCPFYEVLNDIGFKDLAYAFCLSDPVFTKNVLPGVKFSRSNVIAKNGPYCDNKWTFHSSKKS